MPKEPELEYSMRQISLRQIILIVIGFALFFTFVTLALAGHQFFLVVVVSALAVLPIMLMMAITFLACKCFAVITMHSHSPNLSGDTYSPAAGTTTVTAENEPAGIEGQPAGIGVSESPNTEEP